MIRIGLFAIILSLATNACRDEKNRLSGIPVSDFYNSCDAIFDFGETITIGDPNNKFMMTFPYSWDISEIYSDTLYGIIAMKPVDLTDGMAEYRSVSVFGYNSTLSLSDYTVQEINNLKNDRQKKVKETGMMEIKGIDARWIWYEDRASNPNLENIVVYIRNHKMDEVFIIQSSVLKQADSETMLCQLKNLVRTFEFVD